MIRYFIQFKCWLNSNFNFPPSFSPYQRTFNPSNSANAGYPILSPLDTSAPIMWSNPGQTEDFLETRSGKLPEFQRFHTGSSFISAAKNPHYTSLSTVSFVHCAYNIVVQTWFHGIPPPFSFQFQNDWQQPSFNNSHMIGNSQEKSLGLSIPAQTPRVRSSQHHLPASQSLSASEYYTFFFVEYVRLSLSLSLWWQQQNHSSMGYQTWSLIKTKWKRATMMNDGEMIF